ncbi:acyltransferase family protein [Lentzea sp. BCCO 10_0061]|uniref:Acyltransferase family protein n=1 Tax=Lentzea sokolovensis TaxID=3095429 RepID=A0ABU4UNI8_9PSEU|nr:acyltransferase family protein [Lentzea sp. BCCO 10_0061]MDX8140599.1 acyltransferase family protein [Lentzea sp. BCCO 10_0061]
MTPHLDVISTSRPARISYIDNLRVFLTLLVVAHHSAVPHSSLDAWPKWQPSASSPGSGPLDLLLVVNQTFFMGFFFLLSGYFAPGAVDRRGPRDFAVERLKRLGIPFLGFVVLLRPLFVLPDYVNLPAATRPSFAVHYFTTWEVGPAWFLELLLIFSLAYALSRYLRAAAEPARSRPLRRRDVLAFVLVLSAVTYAWRIFVPHGTKEQVLGLPTPAYMPQYVLLFAVGIAAYRHHWLATPPRRSGWFGVLLVVVSLVPLALGGYRGFGTSGALAGHDLVHLALALSESLFAVGVILVLLRAFARFAAGTSRFRRYLADNAFAVYLVHAPLIVGVEAALLRLDAAPVPKFLLTLVIAAVGSWAISGALRRVPAVRATL